MWSEEDNYKFYLEQKKSRQNTVEYHLRKIIKKQEEELSDLKSKYESKCKTIYKQGQENRRLKKELNEVKTELNEVKKN
tara:strand:+ start:216 stop:452 length:237 start_codon:yes stop_codon:yes gene_type:complete